VSCIAGKPAGARRSPGPQAKVLSGLTVAVAPLQLLLWVAIELSVGWIPALVDTGSRFSCVWAGVAQFLYLMNEPCSFTCSVTCPLADRQRCQVTNAVELRVKLLSFALSRV